MKTNSLQLVAGISKAQVVSLRATGVNTVRELGAFEGNTETMGQGKSCGALETSQASAAHL